MYAAAPTVCQASSSGSDAICSGTAIVKISARIGANDTAPARRPQAIVIIAPKPSSAMPRPIAHGSGCSSRASTVAHRLSMAATGTRLSVRDTVFGTSARLAHTVPPSASAPASEPTSSWISPMPSAAARPLRDRKSVV